MSCGIQLRCAGGRIYLADMDNELAQKEARLRDLLRRSGRPIVAFSGGVDSSFLAFAAKREWPDAVAVTVMSPFLPERELAFAREQAAAIGITHEMLPFMPFSLPEIRSNPPDRCYLCKREVFGRLIRLAMRRGFAAVLDGSNTDDRTDYRPGMRALAELSVVSPLCGAGLGKDDIRELSRESGVAGHDRPAAACLATRVPHGDELTPEKLRLIEKAEDFLLATGFRLVRVRLINGEGVVETGLDELERATGNFSRIAGEFARIGIGRTTIDRRGYRRGSLNPGMNEA